MTKPDAQFISAIADGSGCLRTSHEGQTVPWWSFSKTVLASAALRLVEQNCIRLDEPLLPHGYTLRQLLGHQAGVTDYGSLASYHAAIDRGETPWTDAELLERTASHKLLFAPGTGWSYSNIGYLFVRRIIEEATALPLQTALKELLFSPLNLSSVRGRQPI